MDERLKRRLLSEVADENLRAIRNQPPPRLPPRRRFSWAVAFATLAIALATTALWFSLAPRSAATVPRAASAPDAAAAERPAAGAATQPVFVAGGAARVPGEVFPLAVRRVVLDPGHGGGDLGTRTPTGLAEKDLTLDIARRVARRLAAIGIDSRLTRDDDRRVSLADRARKANQETADLFVSIHVNWFEDGRANRGIETFFLGPSDDPAVTRLASTENRESGYSLAEMRQLLDSIYAGLRQEQSRALAAAVHRQLLASIRKVAPEVRDRGVKSAPFLVLVTTEMPAILAEVACLSNAEEARLLGQADYRDRLAGALFDGIATYSRTVERSGPGDATGRVR